MMMRGPAKPGPAVFWRRGDRMPVSFQILPERGLTVVRYFGFVTIDDSLRAIARYPDDPAFTPDQKFMFDSTDVTGHEKDHVRFLAMQSRMTEVFAQTGQDQFVGCVAPNEIAREMAAMVQRGWEPVKHFVMFIHDDEAEVLAFLGQPERSIAQLMANTRSFG